MMRMRIRGGENTREGLNLQPSRNRDALPLSYWCGLASGQKRLSEANEMRFSENSLLESENSQIEKENLQYY